MADLLFLAGLFVPPAVIFAGLATALLLRPVRAVQPAPRQAVHA